MDEWEVRLEASRLANQARREVRDDNLTKRIRWVVQQLLAEGWKPPA